MKAASLWSANKASQNKAIYIACNVYVSAGSEVGHGPLLLNLLHKAQSACQAGEVGVVHAFADRIYNRSSFHLVGKVDPLSHVTTGLVTDAVKNLRSFPKQTPTDEEIPQVSHHPSVGVVDHVAVMPIEKSDKIDMDTPDVSDFCPSTPSGIAARCIGKALQDLGVQVYYYGSAHPTGTPLAMVRKDKTRFFHSGGLASECSEKEESADIATVGAPLEFVENYNIRLTALCPKKKAQSLTKLVRQRDGGLPGVEALTLPYSEGRWEVACNLLHPKISSTSDIDALVEKWQRKEESMLSGDKGLVETSYRVGTTASQCREAIVSFDQSAWDVYNQKVSNQFQRFVEG
jgi:hypothetical protein